MSKLASQLALPTGLRRFLLVASAAYAMARRHADDGRFAFGTGKLGYLAGFANAVVLAGTALLIAAESNFAFHFLRNPKAINSSAIAEP